SHGVDVAKRRHERFVALIGDGTARVQLGLRYGLALFDELRCALPNGGVLWLLRHRRGRCDWQYKPLWAIREPEPRVHHRARGIPLGLADALAGDDGFQLRDVLVCLCCGGHATSLYSCWLRSHESMISSSSCRSFPVTSWPKRTDPNSVMASASSIRPW